jgi:hypothetical protein
MMQSYASAAKLRSGGPILLFGIESQGNTSGLRHLEPSSATRHQRTARAETVGCPSVTSVHYAGRRTTPSGTTPSRTRRQRAISSLRAKATIMVLRVPRALPFYEFDISDFFHSDGAPTEVATKRQDGFFRLAALYQQRFAKSRQTTSEATRQISDLQFTSSYRVPFQYSRMVREHLGAGTFMQSSSGVTLTDLDGNVFCDLAGSYGVDMFGYDFYKECIENAERRSRSLAPCSASTIWSSPTTSSGFARFPGSTKSRSTCPAPKR